MGLVPQHPGFIIHIEVAFWWVYASSDTAIFLLVGVGGAYIGEIYQPAARTFFCGVSKLGSGWFPAMVSQVWPTQHYGCHFEQLTNTDLFFFVKAQHLVWLCWVLGGRNIAFWSQSKSCMEHVETKALKVEGPPGLWWETMFVMPEKLDSWCQV